MSQVLQAEAAVAFVRQSICEALSNVLHPYLKNDFNGIISNVTTTEAALVRNTFQNHHTPSSPLPTPHPPHPTNTLTTTKINTSSTL